MKNAVVFMILTLAGSAARIQAQEIPVIKDRETALLEPLRLSGPRVGITYLTELNSEKVQKRLDEASLELRDPVLYQFGWQFEWKYFETRGGSAGLLEIIPLIGGLDQGIFLPSLNILVGYRDATGLELGFGPNINLIGTGFTAACGYTFQSEHMNFPVNLAYTRSNEGDRLTFLVGFTKRTF